MKTSAFLFPLLAFLLSSSAAHATMGPFTWEEKVCDADAVVEVEFYWDEAAPRGVEDEAAMKAPPSVRIVKVHANLVDAEVTFDPDVSFRSRYTRGRLQSRDVSFQRQRASRTDRKVKQRVGFLRRAVRGKSVRAVLFLGHDPEDGWQKYEDGEIDRYHHAFVDHPDHEAWLKGIKSLAERRAKAEKAGTPKEDTFCGKPFRWKTSSMKRFTDKHKNNR